MFWRQTARETCAHLEAIGARRRAERNLCVANAWWTAVLSRQEQIPELASLMERGSPAATEEQSDDASLEAGRKIAASFTAAKWEE